ncbi:helix-turn-helix domain-containing protein [Bartonella krasnovii]
MHKYKGSRYTVQFYGGTQSLENPNRDMSLLYKEHEIPGVFALSRCVALKAKKLIRGQYFQTPGILMRGRSQPEGEPEVKAKNPHFPIKNPHSNDILIGKRIRLRREMLKISQKELGHRLGVTFQQIQKYEKGINRVGAGRLQEIADILDISIFFFYADISTKEHILLPYEEMTSSQEEHVLLKSFRELKPKQQKAILCLIAER